MAPAQHEIDFKYDEALKTADNIMTFKLAVKYHCKSGTVMFASIYAKAEVRGEWFRNACEYVAFTRKVEKYILGRIRIGENGLSREAHWFHRWHYEPYREP